MLPSFIHFMSRAKRLIVVAPELSGSGQSPAKYRMGGWLVVLVVAIVIIADSEQDNTVQATDLFANAGPASAVSLIAADQLVWVRQEPPVINANGDPLLYESLEPRFEGSYTQYDVDETNISMEERFVDYGHEFYHIFIDSIFDRPPLVLNPPLRYKVRGNVTHSGAPTEGAEGIGARFWYSSDSASIEPQEVLAYFPWSPYFNGTNSKDWMLEAPPITQEGQTFNVIFGWWNCAPCNVTWTYRAEPANAVEQLGVEVIDPVVKYQGDEVQPGQTFFPDTCALPDSRTTDLCSYTTELSDQGQIDFKCVSEMQDRLLALLEFVDLAESEDDNATMKKFIMWVGTVKIAENCEYDARAIGGYQLDLVIAEGATLSTNIISEQVISVATPLGTAMSAGSGSFLAGYNPDTVAAVFRAYSVPLTIQPLVGTKLVLPPAHQVELTDEGFGPVTEMPRIFLPMQIR